MVCYHLVCKDNLNLFTRQLVTITFVSVIHKDPFNLFLLQHIILLSFLILANEKGEVVSHYGPDFPNYKCNLFFMYFFAK